MYIYVGRSLAPTGFHVHLLLTHPNGHRFKKLEKLSQQLLYQRAVAKKYNPANTTFKGGKGADPRRSLGGVCLSVRARRGSTDQTVTTHA